MKYSGREATTGKAAALLAVLIAAAITGCAAGSGARLDRSRDVFDAFMAGTVLPGYTYYTTGVQNNPDAILGIKEGITLRTERWKQREMTEPALRQLVGQMNATYAADHGLLGLAVLNDRGERIGIWYSPVGLAVVEMLAPTEVRVTPPGRVEMEKYRNKGEWKR